MAMEKDKLTGNTPVIETGWRMPERKTMAGGLTGVAAWALIVVANKFGAGIPIEFAPLISTALTAIVMYVVPPALRDVLGRMNDQVVAIAAADPNVPVDSSTAPRK